MKVGDACGSLQAPPPKVATLTGSWGRDGPRRIEGDARRKQHAHKQSRRSRYSEVAPRRIDPASNAGPLRRLGRFRVRTEATDNVAWPLLKNRVLTSSVNTWPPLAGGLLTGRRRATHTDLHHRQRRRRSLRPSWGRPLLQLPRILRRPRSLTGSPTRVTSSRNALTARTKRYGLTSRSTVRRT